MFPWCGVGKAAAHSRVAVCIFHIGLYVVYGGSVRKVGAPYFEYSFGSVYAGQPYRAQAYGIGSVGRTRGEYSHARVASETGRAHRQLPFRSSCPVEVEAPEQPYIVELFQTPERIGRAVPGFEHDPAVERGSQPRLPRQRELPSDGGAEVCYGLDFHWLYFQDSGPEAEPEAMPAALPSVAVASPTCGAETVPAAGVAPTSRI